MSNLKNITTLLCCSFVLLCAQFAVAQQVCEVGKAQPSTPSGRFELVAPQVVQDSATGLQWSVCVEGLAGESCEQGEAQRFNWAEALLYVAEVNKNGLGGFNDWRLANIRELTTLVELQCASPAINSEIFPAAPSAHVWTSSPYHFYTHYSWFVDFANGSYTYDERTQPKYVRLVRTAG